MSGDISEITKLITGKRIRQRIVISEFPNDALFIYKKHVWRSLGKLRKESHSVTAQKVKMNKYGTEVVVDTADFSEHILVEPYDGKVPMLGENEIASSKSQYQVSKKF